MAIFGYVKPIQVSQHKMEQLEEDLEKLLKDHGLEEYVTYSVRTMKLGTSEHYFGGISIKPLIEADAEEPDYF